MHLGDLSNYVKIFNLQAYGCTNILLKKMGSGSKALRQSVSFLKSRDEAAEISWKSAFQGGIFRIVTSLKVLTVKFHVQALNHLNHIVGKF